MDDNIVADNVAVNQGLAYPRARSTCFPIEVHSSIYTFDFNRSGPLLRHRPQKPPNLNILERPIKTNCRQQFVMERVLSAIRFDGRSAAVEELLARGQGGLVFKARRLLYHSTLGRE